MSLAAKEGSVEEAASALSSACRGRETHSGGAGGGGAETSRGLVCCSPDPE